MNNAILIIENNQWMLDILLNNLPKTFDTSIMFYIVIEDRIGTTVKMVDDTFKKYGMSNYFVLTASQINEKIKSDITDTPFVDSYTMSTKITASWYILKYTDVDRFLLMDDDIYLNDGINKIFDVDHTMWFSNILASGIKNMNTESSDTNGLFEELFTAFNITYDRENPFKGQPTYIGAGHFYIVRNDLDIDRYEKGLKYFFNSKLIYDLWNKRNNRKKKDAYRHLCIDERFIQVLAWNNPNKELNNYISWLAKKPDKIDENAAKATTKKPIVHICIRDKEPVYAKLINYGVIKGDADTISKETHGVAK